MIVEDMSSNFKWKCVDKLDKLTALRNFTDVFVIRYGMCEM
jgi:hypothetical protein